MILATAILALLLIALPSVVILGADAVVVGARAVAHGVTAVARGIWHVVRPDDPPPDPARKDPES
jgi:hypothetical protein